MNSLGTPCLKIVHNSSIIKKANFGNNLQKKLSNSTRTLNVNGSSNVNRFDAYKPEIEFIADSQLSSPKSIRHLKKNQFPIRIDFERRAQEIRSIETTRNKKIITQLMMSSKIPLSYLLQFPNTFDKLMTITVKNNNNNKNHPISVKSIKFATFKRKSVPINYVLQVMFIRK